MKAVHDLLQLLTSTMTVGDLRSLNGLLEFIMVVVMFKRNRMQGMYDPFQAGREAEWGPETQAWVTKLMAQSSNAWITTLSAGCAAPFIAALERRDLLRFESFHSVPPSAILYGMTSDASKAPGSRHPWYWWLLLWIAVDVGVGLVGLVMGLGYSSTGALGFRYQPSGI